MGLRRRARQRNPVRFFYLGNQNVLPLIFNSANYFSLFTTIPLLGRVMFSKYAAVLNQQKFSQIGEILTKVFVNLSILTTQKSLTIMKNKETQSKQTQTVIAV